VVWIFGAVLLVWIVSALVGAVGQSVCCCELSVLFFCRFIVVGLSVWRPCVFNYVCHCVVSLQMPMLFFGNVIGQCHLATLFGDALWQRHLTVVLYSATWACHSAMLLGTDFVICSAVLLGCHLAVLLGAAIGQCHLALLFVGHCFFAVSSGSAAWYCHWVVMATATESGGLGIALDFLKTDNRKIEKRTIYQRLQQHPNH